MATIETTLGTIEYRTAGPDHSEKPPVLFIHGALVDAELWRKPAELLAAQGYRCYLPTLPLGSHRIPMKPDAELSPTTIAGLIRELIVGLDLHDATLVGNDTGGALCQFTIDAHPEHVGRLVLTNCDAFDTFPPFPFDVIFKLLKLPGVLKPSMKLMKFQALRHSPLGFGLLANDPDPDPTASWVAPAQESAEIRRDITRLFANIKPAELDAVTRRLGSFDKPVTLVWGMADKSFKPELGRRLAAQFPNATFTEVPGARTFVSLDNPDAVADAVVQISAPASSST
ncbi:alpha/beta fold hydrolase [Williamsia soli]|uniref:alpha/beta fold hydrolase n=1 Tax=Williamsia soli TaxID=364929 RepID=UPI001A9DF181|nr:alpha/beta hydrolase [Williamsia soli]